MKSQDKSLGPIEIDPDEFHKMLVDIPKFLRVSDEMIRSVKLPVLRLQYGQLLVDPQATIKSIFQFLGVRFTEFHSRFKKNTNDDLRKVIKNFDKLRERYVGTKYEPMFDEVLIP